MVFMHVKRIVYNRTTIEPRDCIITVPSSWTRR
jgi:hypothetical protein